MKKTLVFLVISGTAALIISSCSKKNDSAAYTVKQVAGSYKLTAATVTAAGTTVDFMQYIDDCEKDDLEVLHEDSTYTHVDAGVSCGGSDESTGKFVIKGNLLISDYDQQYPDTVTIKSFNGTALVVTQTETESGTTATLTRTLTKQ